MMRALTVHRPWDQAILHGGKDTENRVWKLWDKMIGVPVAIHAGKQYDHDGVLWMLSNGFYVPPSPDDSPQGIVGVVVFSGMVTNSASPWFVGPFGWNISSSRALKEPIAIKGKQGLWEVPREIELEIDRQLAGGGIG